MTPLLVGLTLVFGAPGAKDPPKKDSPSLIGVWIGETGIKGGKPSPPDSVSMEFEKDGTLTFKEKIKAITGSYKADAKASPAQLDLTLGAGGQMISFLGIFKIEGDTLTICFTFMGDRPTKFESPDGSMTMLITLKRAKKD